MDQVFSSPWMAQTRHVNCLNNPNELRSFVSSAVFSILGKRGRGEGGWEGLSNLAILIV